MNFAKRCCADDANLCELVEINAGKVKEQHEYVKSVLDRSNFDTMYRRQLEKVSANGTVACYIRIENALFLSNGRTKGGEIKLNYVDADCYIPLTVENDIITEAAFSGSSLVRGKKRTTLVLFRAEKHGNYISDTHVFDEFGNELKDQQITVNLGEVKPFAVMRTAEVNNFDNMEGYGFPKVLNSIPVFEGLDLCYNILFGDLDKGEKLVLINEMLCKFDKNGNPITPNEQIKKIFVMLGEKLPQEDDVYHEYNPEIRVEQITKVFELLLSLLSMSFGYGTKKYTFENGQITTATEYIGQKQDQMQDLNRQRFEATQYIKDIVRAVLWYSNTFLGSSWNVDDEISVDYDDSYITDKEAERERKRNDALSFDIPQLKVWYLMDAYSLGEEEAKQLLNQSEMEDSGDDSSDDGEGED
ncbi:MAG: hypothetical protein NC123_16715 [Butyrivibrio sp.]|nr:hypothetical protein [Acetatifactor muris]MCM1561161.1 hypothetical protein [Butyrivibrio sp.]